MVEQSSPKGDEADLMKSQPLQGASGAAPQPLWADDSLLNPDVILCHKGPTRFAGVYHSSWFYDKSVALLRCACSVLDAFRHYKHLSFEERDIPISKFNLHISAQYDEDLIRILVVMPYKLTLEFY